MAPKMCYRPITYKNTEQTEKNRNPFAIALQGFLEVLLKLQPKDHSNGWEPYTKNNLMLQIFKLSNKAPQPLVNKTPLHAFQLWTPRPLKYNGFSH